jgi:hypothetical protein
MEEGTSDLLPLLDPLPVLEGGDGKSGSATSKTALGMLVQGDSAFVAPSKVQRRNLAMAFAAKDKVVYGRAFDAVKIRSDSAIDLGDLDSVRSNLDDVVLYEVKSTNRADIDSDFDNYFFALTTAELLVAQSLGAQFRFLFIHTLTGHRLELSLTEVYKKARAIYPGWSIRF